MSAATLPPGPVEPTAEERRAGLAALLTAAAFFVLGVTVSAGTRPAIAGGVVACGLFTAAVIVRRPYLPWSRILTVLVLVVLFIPLRRYTLPGDAGLSLEPYRVLVAVIIAGWGAALLSDSRVRLRKSGLEGTLAFLVVVIMASDLANPGRVGPLQSEVLKSVTFLFSFLLVFYLVVSVVRTTETLNTIVKTLVWGGAVIGFFAVIESRTGFSPFVHVDKVFPILIPDPTFASGLNRGGAIRAVGPAEHPIALGAVLVMLVPLAVYVVRTAGGAWYIAFAAITIGVLSTVSRTGILMLLALCLVFLWLRTAEMKRMWPLLLPVIVLTQFAVPGTLGSLKQSFFPEGGLVSEQQGSRATAARPGGWQTSARRWARWPTSRSWATGSGRGSSPEPSRTRASWTTSGSAPPTKSGSSASWPGCCCSSGSPGAMAGRRRRTTRDSGWLLVAVTASVTAYAVGSFTFDSLGFSQVTFVLFLILGLAAAARSNAQSAPRPRAI